jgi:hypothetical protein
MRWYVGQPANACFASFIAAIFTGESWLTRRCPPPQLAHLTGIACPRVEGHSQVGCPSAQWPHLETLEQCDWIFPRLLAFSAQFRPPLAAETHSIMDLLPPDNASDDSSVGSDWAGELDQE